MNASARLRYPQSGLRMGSAASECLCSARLAFFPRAATAIVAAALSGCATVDSVQSNGQLVRHHFGYVRIAVPSPEVGRTVYASDVATLGMRVSDGISLGYTREKFVVLPLDCRLVMLVATANQLNDAMEELSQFKNAPGICAAVSPTLQTGDIP